MARPQAKVSMITEQISQLTNYIQSLNKKEFRKYATATLIGIAILALGATYYVYHTSSSLVEKIKKLDADSNKIIRIIAQNEGLRKEEEKIRIILDKNPNFNMSTYFERFYTKHKIQPEPNWKPEQGTIIEGFQEGIKYQEIILQATFKKQTMQKLVTMLQDVYKEPIIYLKALEISTEEKTINFELTLATKQYIKEAEE